METQKNLESWQQATVGTEEAQRLEPKGVKILSQVKIQVNSKKKPGSVIEKIVFSCKHPDREEPIEISDIKCISNDKVEIRASWYLLDSKGGIQKNSALAMLLVHYGCRTLGELVGQSAATALDDRGYLCLKAY